MAKTDLSILMLQIDYIPPLAPPKLKVSLSPALTVDRGKAVEILYFVTNWS